MPAPVIKDRRAALLFGVLGVAGGSWLLWQAYEARGRTRPLAIRVLPGL